MDPATLAAASTVAGFVARLAPEALRWALRRSEDAHEYRMALLSAATSTRLQEMRAEAAADAGRARAWLDVARIQARPSGFRWIDALSAAVRPVVTFWWLAIYTAWKAAVLATAWHAAGALAALAAAWTADDMAILGSILGFWFCGRVFEKAGR